MMQSLSALPPLNNMWFVLCQDKDKPRKIACPYHQELAMPQVALRMLHSDVVNKFPDCLRRHAGDVLLTQPNCVVVDIICPWIDMRWTNQSCREDVSWLGLTPGSQQEVEDVLVPCRPGAIVLADNGPLFTFTSLSFFLGLSPVSVPAKPRHLFSGTYIWIGVCNYICVCTCLYVWITMRVLEHDKG